MTSSYRYDTYYPTNKTVFTFNGPDWHWHNWTQVPSTSPYGNYNHSYTAYENFTFTFPDPAVAYFLYGVRESNLGFSQYAICSDCDPRTDSFHTFDTATMKTYGPSDQPSLLYTDSWVEPGIHKILVWNLPNTNGITIQRMEVWVPVPPEPPKTFSVREFSGAVSASILSGLLLVALVLWLWMRKRKTTDVLKDTKAATGNDYEASSDESVAVAKDDLEKRLCPGDGEGLEKTNSVSVTTDMGYRGLPEPADRNDVRPGTGAPSRQVSYTVHGRDLLGSVSGSNRDSGAPALVVEPIREVGEEIGYKGLPEPRE